MGTPLTNALVGDKLAELHALRIDTVEQFWGVVQADCQNFLASHLEMSEPQMAGMINAIKPFVPMSIQTTGPARRHSMGCLGPV